MKILTIVGARPQFVKAAVISREIAKHNQSGKAQIREVIVHTGQHYDANMSDIFFSEMGIPKPDYHLNIGGGTHGAMTGQMLERIESVLFQEKPDVLLVYGDTNSTLAGALAASKLHVPVAHVEAGLRSFNMRMPEEINRVLTDHVAKWLFCPTATAVDNLNKEGFSSDDRRRVLNVGDVMYDAVLHYKGISKPSENILSLMDTLKRDFFLATVHRAENTDFPERLHAIIRALARIAKDTPVVLPLHPRTKKYLDSSMLAGLNVIDPVGYFDMIGLLDGCKGVFTDSGGVQKEAYFFGKPCVTLRDETEWLELVNIGVNVLAGADEQMILQAAKGMSYVDIKEGSSLYGDGFAGRKIIDNLLATA